MSKRFKLTFAYFCSMLALSILNIIISSVPTRLSDNGLTIFYTTISQVLRMGVIPLVVAYFLFYRKKNSNSVEQLDDMRKDFLYKLPSSPKVWLLVVPISILFYFFTMLVSRVLFMIILISGYTPVAGVGTIYGGPWNLVMWIFVGALLPAVFEEFTHRGLLISGLRDRGNEVEMIMLSGFLFGAMHGNIVQFGYAFIGGIVMGYLVIKTGSIFPAMLLHFMNNAVDHIIRYSSQKGGGIGRLMDGFYNLMTSPFTLLIAAGILIANAVLVIYLLSLIPKLGKNEAGIRERAFLGGRFMLDTYRIDGKPMLRDNVMLYAVAVMLMLQTLFTYIWGQLR